MLTSGEIVHIAGSGISGGYLERATAVEATLFRTGAACPPRWQSARARRSESERRTGYRRVSPEGIITTIAGGGPWAPSIPNNSPARRAHFFSDTFGVAPDRTIYIPGFARRLPGTLHRVVPTLKPDLAAAYIVPSANRGEAYKFDESGQHLRTRTSASGIIRYAFEYDTDGRLTGIVDTNDRGRRSSVARGGVPIDADRAVAGTAPRCPLQAVCWHRSPIPPTIGRVDLWHERAACIADHAQQRQLHLRVRRSRRLIRDTDPAGGVQTLSRVLDAKRRRR